MTIDPWTGEPFVIGALTAICAMTLVTYLCRISGYVLMGYVPLTPAIRRGLSALPGSIVVATLVPFIEKTGPSAAIALGAAVIAMIYTRKEFMALIAGLIVVASVRQAGL